MIKREKFDWNKLKQGLRTLAYDSIDWKWTTIRMFWNGAIAYLVAGVMMEFWGFVVGKYSLPNENGEIGRILAWTLVVIYLILKMPGVHKEDYIENKLEEIKYGKEKSR